MSPSLQTEQPRWSPGFLSLVAASILALTHPSFLCAADPASSAPKPTGAMILSPDTLRALVSRFNAADRELYIQHIPNSEALEFLEKNIPLLDCPDKEIVEIYYFRWWTYRKHIKSTPDGFIITEFIPKVNWAGKHNSNNGAAGLHFYEGRWLNDPSFLDDYSIFWFRKGGNPRSYSFWAADAIRARAMVSGDMTLPKELLPDLVANYREWEKLRLDPNGLFWQIDDRDGMEKSIAGNGYRVTINSYMYGDALAIAAIAEAAGNMKLADEFREKAAKLKRLVLEKLWDPSARFFKVSWRDSHQPPPPADAPLKLADVRELHGYTPWYFCLPDNEQSDAWKQLLDPQGFSAPYGPTTAERRHPKFSLSYSGHECQWNGPSWPYSTAITLTGMANLLNQYRQDYVTREDYLNILKTYTRSQHMKLEDGSTVPWIDENLNPLTGDWLSRTRLKTWENGTWSAKKGGEERGKDYNHSTYCDLVITGLIGLRPRTDDIVEVNPLVPASWEYFCLDRVRYHGRWLTIMYDRTGSRYGRGTGLFLFADGKEIAHTPSIQLIKAELPKTASN